MPRPLISLPERLARLLASHRPRTENDPTLIRAAVAVIAVPDPDALLFIRRAERPGDPWSGQMAFPGGRAAEEDLDLLTTASREVLEEVGLSLRSDDCLGALDDVAPRTPHLPPILVRPFVFGLPARPALRPNLEVAEVVWAPFAELTSPDRRSTWTFEREGATRVFPAYRVGEHVVWGMTERILSPLLAALDSAE